MRNKILLIEDDLGLALPLKEFFEDHGLVVCHTATGKNALHLYRQETPDLILLDIILPEKSGFEIIAEIRAVDLDVPIIMMTGTAFDPESEIKGYQYGALNYMHKPVLPQAVLALIQQILRAPKDLVQFQFGRLQIQIQSQSVKIGPDNFRVREKDALLLIFLLERVGQIIPRTTLLQQIWLDDHVKNNNLLDGAVLRLRKLFKEHPSIRIKSVYGNGYILENISANQIHSNPV